MPTLSDPKLEAFTQALLRRLASLTPVSKAADLAAMDAGYRGSSRASNARKRAQRPDVKARLAELAAPKLAEIETQLSIDVAGANGRLDQIIKANVNLDESVEPKDVINAIKLKAQMNGWMAPEKVEHTLNGLGDRLDRALAGGGNPSQANRTGETVPSRSA